MSSENIVEAVSEEREQKKGAWFIPLIQEEQEELDTSASDTNGRVKKEKDTSEKDTSEKDTTDREDAERDADGKKPLLGKALFARKAGPKRKLESKRKLGRMMFESAKWEYDHASSSKYESLYRQVYLIVFLLSIYIANVSNLVSTLVPIITQPDKTMSGDNLDFGNVLVREEALIGLGFSSSDFVRSGIDTATDAFLVDIASIDGTTLLSGKTYAEAFDIAKAINEKHIEEVGGCTSVDASGGLSGSSSLVQYTCAPYTSTTRNEISRWIDLEESKCASDYIPLTDLFHNCMLFGSHNPGSMYIIAGEATAVANMDCTYPTLEMYSWNINTGLSLSSKIMNNHILECTGHTGTQVSHGFVTQEYMSIYQTWPYYTEHFSFEKKCIDDSGGSIVSSNMWEGDVQLGLQQIFMFCSSKGYLNGPSCWNFIFDSLDPESESWSTWKAFSESSRSDVRDFAENLVQSAFDKSVPYSQMWHSFSEIALNWNITGPSEVGTTYYKNSTRSEYLISYDAFRRTFGWGWDLYPNVIGSNQWDVTTKGLYSTSSLGLFPIGTQHTVELSCVSSGSKLDSTVVGDNYRESGVIILVPYWSKLINAFMMVFSLGFALLVSSSNRLVKVLAREFFADENGVKQRRTMSEIYFLIGLISVVVEGGTYLFESAIPNNLSTSCNMKVTATLDNYAAVIVDSFVNRWTVAGLSVVLTQTLCWLQNRRGILATGIMPRHIATLLMSVGFFYAVALSVSSIVADDSCASEVNLYLFDLLFPVVVALFAVYFMTSCMTHDGRYNLVCRYEGDRYRFHSSEEDDLDHDEDSGIPTDEAVGLTLAATTNRDSNELQPLEGDVEMAQLGGGSGAVASDILDSSAATVAVTPVNSPSCGEGFALYSVSRACTSSNHNRDDPNIVLFARPCPFTLDNNSELEENFRPYGVHTNGLMYRISPVVLTFDGAISLSNFNNRDSAQWPTLDNGEIVDYSDDRCFRLVEKSLSCTGVMSTTAAVELEDAQEAKRSSKKFEHRRRESLGRDEVNAGIKQFRASIHDEELGDFLDDEIDNKEGEITNEKIPLRWHHMLRIFAEVSIHPIMWIFFPLFLAAHAMMIPFFILSNIVPVIAYLITSPLILFTFCEKFIRFLRGKDRFRVLRSSLFTNAGYSCDYEGQYDDKSRPHGFGRVYLTDDKSQIFEGTFKRGKAHGYCRLIYDRKLEYKSLLSCWNILPDTFLIADGENDGENYCFTSDILGSLGVHRNHIDNLFRIHNYPSTVESCFLILKGVHSDLYGAPSWADQIDVEPKCDDDLNNGDWCLNKDEEQLQIDYLYENGVTKSSLWLLYAGKETFLSSDKQISYAERLPSSSNTQHLAIYRRSTLQTPQTIISR